jgi:UDP-glucose 4-epimerase
MKFFITGGAGFLGSNLVNTLLDAGAGEVRVYDNLSSGRERYFGHRLADPRLTLVRGEVGDLDRLTEALAESDVVFHLAANPDIARAITEPTIDFDNGTVLTQCVLEAMRRAGTKRIVFTSGSGVYGEVPPRPVPEDWPHMVPISTYGAAKLASEALISAYCHMFGLVGTVFRFANVVGPNMTHGVTHDFIRRLSAEPRRLLIYGDGEQLKHYIHTADVIAAMRLLLDRQSEAYAVYNVASTDRLKVVEIADIVVKAMGLSGVEFAFTGGARGWRGDVPVYELDTTRIRALGWQNRLGSRAAVEAAARSLIDEIAGEPTPG